MQRRCPKALQHRLDRFLTFAPRSGVADVPDPYYGGPHGFARVFDLIEEASLGLLEHIEANAAEALYSEVSHREA